MNGVTVIGAGLAGSECAWQLANQGVPVTLYEMRPKDPTPAHHSGFFAELVCSNSLGGQNLTVASGLLKEELRRLNSLVIALADRHRVPAGGSLAVDRWAFSSEVTSVLESHPLISIRRERVDALPSDRPLVIATGPLTGTDLAAGVAEFAGSGFLYFFDAAAPIVTLESLDMSRMFWASRYGKGDQFDYLNAPMNADEYGCFHVALCAAELHEGHDFDDIRLFEGCLPIEELARRGVDTPRYGPLKPVGLTDPATGRRPYAVVQLRRDNVAGTLFNLVGFQTRLKISGQKRVFGMIPGLAAAEYVRYGKMHRNTFIDSPRLLRSTLQTKQDAQLFFAGQITGSEGYVESVAGGLLAGINAGRLSRGMEPVAFDRLTAIGALFHYITTTTAQPFQPMNVNYGLLPEPEERVSDKRERHHWKAERALAHLQADLRRFGHDPFAGASTRPER